MAQVLAASAWTEELHYLNRARTFMGLAAETRTRWSFHDFDKLSQYNTTFLSKATGTGGKNFCDSEASSIYMQSISDAAGERCYTFGIDGGSVTADMPLPASGPWYFGMRWKVSQSDVAVTATDFIWATRAGPELIRVRPDGSGNMVVSCSDAGVTYATLGSYVQDTNWHVIEVYSTGAAANCAIDGVVGTPTATRIPGSATLWVTHCYGGATPTVSEVWIDWLAVAR